VFKFPQLLSIFTACNNADVKISRLKSQYLPSQEEKVLLTFISLVFFFAFRMIVQCIQYNWNLFLFDLQGFQVRPILHQGLLFLSSLGVPSGRSVARSWNLFGSVERGLDWSRTRRRRWAWESYCGKWSRGKSEALIIAFVNTFKYAFLFHA